MNVLDLSKTAYDRLQTRLNSNPRCPVLDMDHPVFDSFKLLVLGNMFCDFEVMEPNEFLLHDNFFEPGTKILKYTSHYFPRKDFVEISDPTDAIQMVQKYGSAWQSVCLTNLNIYLQMTKQDGTFGYRHACSGEGADSYLSMSRQEQNKEIMSALITFAFINSFARKERHRFKKLMPTPTQKEKCDKTNAEYRSEPIKIDGISVQYVYLPHESRKYERHCEAWGVRGHWRHYKSGKVVFIKPHTKGSGRVKDTVYSI